MAKIEKTVFISYRRTNVSWAMNVYRYLKDKGYDVFLDYTSIPSGDFKQFIVSSIKARAHFIIILTPNALDNINKPRDWLRFEIETALHEKRNIIPLFFDGFDFSEPSISKMLSGELQILSKYNGREIPALYFDQAMEFVCDKFLNVALDSVLHPVPDEVRKQINERQKATDKALAEQKAVEKPVSQGDVVINDDIQDGAEAEITSQEDKDRLADILVSPTDQEEMTEDHTESKEGTGWFDYISGGVMGFMIFLLLSSTLQKIFGLPMDLDAVFEAYPWIEDAYAPVGFTMILGGVVLAMMINDKESDWNWLFWVISLLCFFGVGALGLF